MFQAKQEEINVLNDKLKQQIIETKEEHEKREELDLYIEVKEDTLCQRRKGKGRTREDMQWYG